MATFLSNMEIVRGFLCYISIEYGEILCTIYYEPIIKIGFFICVSFVLFLEKAMNQNEKFPEF